MSRTPARPPKKSAAPKSRAKASLNGRQISVLMSLSIVLLVLITGLGFFIAQSVVLAVEAPPNYYAGAVDTLPTTSNPLPPPTHTPASSPISTPTGPAYTLTPSQIPPSEGREAGPILTLQAPASPVPSLTPFQVYQTFNIGYSVEGRPLEIHRFGNGPHQRLIVAGIHGGWEWNTITLAYELIDYLVENPSTIPAHITLYVLPALNPDGEARARSADGRVNANGVDLNRNWDADWKAAWPRHGCWSFRPTTSGPYPGSEPETQALMEFLLDHHIGAMISYHSAALGIFPSGNPPHPDSVRLAQEIAAVSPYPYPPYDTGCQYSGALIDWAHKLGIMGVDVELLNHEDTDFDINLKVLTVLLNWNP